MAFTTKDLAELKEQAAKEFVAQPSKRLRGSVSDLDTAALAQCALYQATLTLLRRRGLLSDAAVAEASVEFER